MLSNVIEDIRKKGKFSFEKIVESNDLSDDEFFELLKFIYSENVPEVRTSVDGSDFIALEDENFYILEKNTTEQAYSNRRLLKKIEDRLMSRD